jgi:hypothetical protein
MLSYKKLTRGINYGTLNECIKYVSSGDWGVVYCGGDVNSKFSSFPNIVRIFVRSVPFEMDKISQNFNLSH